MRNILFLPLLILAALIISCDDNNTASKDFVEQCENVSFGHVCEHKYALCIAASCDQDTIDRDKIECGRCDTDDGSCGYCYVFEGQSCSYGRECSEIQPSGDIVYSTYSEELSELYGFKVLVCSNEQEKIMANCMDARCTLTGDSVILTDIVGFDMEIPTAICECSTFEQNGVKTPVSASATLGGNCNQDNCSAIWSTASDSYRGVLNTVHQCDDC